MVVAEVLSGGIGSRLENNDIPKQYITIKNKPIIVYTLETLYKNENIDKIIICCHPTWEEYVKKIVNNFFPKNNKIEITYSGKTRNESMYKGCQYLLKNYQITEDDIILTIDAVRMFVTERIINENIEMAKKYDAVGTFFPVVDAVMESINKTTISNMPKRKYMYQAQAPQTFKIKKLVKYYEALTEEQKQDLVDVTKIFFLNKQTVHMVKGEHYNFKITYPQDIDIAEKYVENILGK